MQTQTFPNQSIQSRSQSPNAPPNRLYDHLQNIYNSSALQNKTQQKNHKNLYFKLIEQNQKAKIQKQQFHKMLNHQQNQQIDLFWQNRQNQLKQRQHRLRQMKNQFREVNSSMLQNQKALTKSMVMPASYQLAHKDYYEDLANYQRKLYMEKERKNKFLDEGRSYSQYKQYQQSLQREKIIEAERKKLRENQEIQQKRLQEMEKWRKKYLQSHNKQAFEVWDKARRSRMSQQDALQNYIVFQGAQQLNQRTSKMKNDIFQRQHATRQHYINELHSQLQHNQYRTANDSKTQRQMQKQILDQRNQLLAQRDRMMKQERQNEHKHHLEVLKSQIKPRNLLPEKEKVEFPGLGSPVHIGKAMADDRRKQLEWLERNLYNELKR